MPVADGQLEDVGSNDRRQVAQPRALGTQKLPDQFIVQWRGLFFRATTSSIPMPLGQGSADEKSEPADQEATATSVV